MLRRALAGYPLSLLILACFAHPAAARADERALALSLSRLFSSGWKYSPTALSSAQPHYARAHEAAPTDPRPAYAMALVAIKNSRHDEARKWLNEVLSLEKHDLASWRALVWVDLLTRQQAAALSGMRTAAEATATNDAATPPERQAMAASLGRMVGFLSSAAAGSVSEDDLAAAEQDVLASLPKSLHVAFVEGKNETITKHEEMKAELARQQETAIEEQTEQKNLVQKKLEEDKGELAEAKEELSEEATKAREKYDAEESALKKEIAPLARRLTALDAQGRQLRNYLVNVDREIERLIASANLERGRDPAREAAMLREADRLRIQSRGPRDELFRVEREMVQVRTQGAGLEAKLREAQVWLQGELRRLGGEGAKLSRAEKGLKAAERKASEPVTGANSRVRVTATRLTSLSTYEEFPLEQEKQRLLDSLGNGPTRQ